MQGVTVSHNSASDGGAVEVAEQPGSASGIPTQLIISVRGGPSLTHTRTASQVSAPWPKPVCIQSKKSTKIGKLNGLHRGRCDPVRDDLTQHYSDSQLSELLYSRLKDLKCWVLQDSVFEGNTVSGQGGALNVVSGQGAHFKNVTFIGNSGKLLCL